MSGMVGQTHHEALDELISAYNVVKNAKESRLVVVTAPMGWGKTRVVQEFYTHLASTQSGDAHYWPRQLVQDINRGDPGEARKKSFPDQFEVLAGAEMEYLWWGLSCQPHQDGTLSNAVANEISQLTTHLGTVFRKLEKKEATSRLAKELAGTLFSAAPFPTVPALLLGLKDAPSTIMQLLKALGTPIGDAGETQFADSSGSQGDLLDRWIPALAAALGAASVPLVIFLDDAHWADPSTIDFLDRLLIANPATLVVATAWPDLLDVQSDGGQRLDAGSFIGRWKDRLTIRRLASLSDVQLTQIAARALDLFPASPIATQLGQRAANNPLLLRLWAGLAPVARSAAAGRALSEADLRDLPDNALDAFNQRWNELPSHVRLVLAAGADQGFEFVPEVLAEALVGAGLTRIPAEASTALEQAPHWVRAVGGVQQFTEPTLYEVARGAKDSLSRTEQRLLRQAFCTALPIIKSNRRWNEFSIRGRSAVLAAHIRATDQHGQGGVEDAAARIVDSHRELASFQPESQSGWRAAAELLLEATTLLSSDSSRDRRTLLSLWDQHATILLRMGRADDALPLFQRALADSVEWLDPLHPDALRTRGNLADCLEAVGRASDALPLHEQTFLERQLTLGVDHLETLASWRNVARCLATVGRLEEALEMFESLVTNADRVLGPNGQLTISARSELAARYYEAGRTMEAVGVLEQVVQDSEESLGPEHPDTIRAKADLATCNGNAGLVAKAVAMMEETLGQFDRTLGVCHPDSIRARGNLAFLYGELGRIGDAIVMEERALEDRERILGPNHRDTITSRNNLAASYQSAGRSLEATLMRERVLAESERVNGPEHPDTTLARSNLAASYQATGRTLEAITMKELVLAERKRLFGVDHPDTLKASANLAVSYRLDGRISKAIAIEERVLADRERVLGHEHPDTLTTRANLTVSYRQAGRTQEAVVIGEQVLADRERILGSDHPDTLKARAILASSYYQDGRIQEAVAIGELVLAERDRILGPDHPSTLHSRDNLASFYCADGCIHVAIAIGERVLADRERVLGNEHPDTLTTRANLTVSYREAGRIQEAIAIGERVLADRERVLGPDHPNTVDSRNSLTCSIQAASRANHSV